MIITVFVLNVHQCPHGIGDDVKNPAPISCFFLGDAVESTSTFKGKQPMKLAAEDTKVWDDFTVVPGYYELDVDFSGNTKGDIKFKLNSATYIQKL
jgi:hypothetical protein